MQLDSTIISIDAQLYYMVLVARFLQELTEKRGVATFQTTLLAMFSTITQGIPQRSTDLAVQVCTKLIFPSLAIRIDKERYGAFSFQLLIKWLFTLSSVHSSSTNGHGDEYDRLKVGAFH